MPRRRTSPFRFPAVAPCFVPLPAGGVRPEVSDFVLAFQRTRSYRPWWEDDLPGEVPVEPPPPPPPPAPLSGRERVAYGILAVVGFLPLFLIFVMIVLAHTPLIAN